MSTPNPDRDRRGADRIPLPKPVPATYGGFAGNIVEFSLTGCRIEHTDRVTPRVSLPLKFTWRGRQVKIQATLVRSEMVPVRGKPGYISGIEFAQSPDDSPGVVREVMAWLLETTKKNAPPPPMEVEEPLPQAAELEEVDDVEEAEALSAPYMQCVLENGRWQKLYVDKPAQPREGFTIAAPSDEREADVLCRAYERADANTRKAMRARFEKALRV